MKPEYIIFGVVILLDVLLLAAVYCIVALNLIVFGGAGK